MLIDNLDMEKGAVLPPKLSGGPLGLGDPSDRSLRKVEKEILIPKKLREKARVICSEEVKAFERCCKASGVSMVVKCRAENAALKQCLEHWYQDEELIRTCTEEYLRERSQYRATGIKQSVQRKEAESP